MALLPPIPVATGSDATAAQINFSRQNNIINSIHYRNFTKTAKATGPGNIGPQRTVPALLAQKPANSPTRVTIEIN